jgi:hypothetical protein
MTPEEHAARAEDLISRARSASMDGWWNARRRRELLAAAQVHATLAAHPPTTSEDEAPPSWDLLDSYMAERDSARRTADRHRGDLDEVRCVLANWGQQPNGSIAEDLEALPDRLSAPSGPPQLRSVPKPPADTSWVQFTDGPHHPS